MMLKLINRVRENKSITVLSMELGYKVKHLQLFVKPKEQNERLCFVFYCFRTGDIFKGKPLFFCMLLFAMQIAYYDEST